MTLLRREITQEDQELWAFFILTYVLMLLTWGVMLVFRIPGAAASASAASTTAKAVPVGLLLLFLGGFSPTIAGVALTWRFGGRDGLRDLWKRAARFTFDWKWVLAILLLPLLALGAQVGVQAARGGKVVEPALFAHPANLIGFTIAIFLGGALSEEFGWRGFALPRLLDRRKFWAANLILGLVWVFWHLPLFFIPGTVQALRGDVWEEFTIFAVWIMGLAVLFGWVYVKTGQSLLAVILFHASVDWFYTLAGTMIASDRIDRLVNAAIVAVLAVVVLVWMNRREGAVISDQLAVVSRGEAP